jgi:hypothetical protein
MKADDAKHPGSPWQNPFIESYNDKLRDELLAVEQIHTLLEAKIMATENIHLASVSAK